MAHLDDKMTDSEKNKISYWFNITVEILNKAEFLVVVLTQFILTLYGCGQLIGLR
ncbi:hypothetical protein MmazTMA_08330 [Methanosarcina mazei]|jgi:hypothetical protein|nr:hypothetical protein MmazTMA_08330 [Methanosarcina mazei]